MNRTVSNYFFSITSLFLIGNTTVRAQGVWSQKANFGGTARRGATAFSIAGMGYVCLGKDGIGPASYQNDLWAYEPTGNTWTQKANFPGPARAWATGFSIGNFGYVATGYDSVTYFRDVWEYDPSVNSWLQKTSILEDSMAYASSFAVGGSGYIGTGIGNGGYVQRFWQHDPAANTSFFQGLFGGSSRMGAAGFASTSKGYITTGQDSAGYVNDLWQYDPGLNAWTQKASFPGAQRARAVAFSIGNKGYVGTGANASFFMNDVWQYDAGMNLWTQMASFPASSRAEAIAFSIGASGYVGLGIDGGGLVNDLWEFRPPCLQINTSSTNVQCNGASDGTATAAPFGGNPSYSYMWRPVSQTTQTATGLPSGSYTVVVTDASFCSDSAVVSIFQPNVLSITPASNPASDCSTCDGSAAAISGGGTAPYTYSWNTGATTSVITGLCAGSYTVYSTDANSCSASVVVVVNCLTALKDADQQPFSLIFQDGALFISGADQDAVLDVFNMEGRMIIHEERAGSGTHPIAQQLSSGIYFARLRTGSRSVSRKFIVE